MFAIATATAVTHQAVLDKQKLDQAAMRSHLVLPRRINHHFPSATYVTETSDRSFIIAQFIITANSNQQQSTMPAPLKLSADFQALTIGRRGIELSAWLPKAA